MKGRVYALLSVFLWGCDSAPFLISHFETDYQPKLKTVAMLPLWLPPQNSLAEKYGLGLERLVGEAVSRADSAGTFVFPNSIRRRFAGAADSSILEMPTEELGKRILVEGLLYARVVRLYETAGSNPTSREIGAARFQRRGVELLFEFRLVEASTGKLLWKYRIRRFGEDVLAAGRQVGKVLTEAWPLHP